MIIFDEVDIDPDVMIAGVLGIIETMELEDTIELSLLPQLLVLVKQEVIVTTIVYVIVPSQLVVVKVVKPKLASDVRSEGFVVVCVLMGPEVTLPELLVSFDIIRDAVVLIVFNTVLVIEEVVVAGTFVLEKVVTMVLALVVEEVVLIISVKDDVNGVLLADDVVSKLVDIKELIEVVLIEVDVVWKVEVDVEKDVVEIIKGVENEVEVCGVEALVEVEDEVEDEVEIVVLDDDVEEVVWDEVVDVVDVEEVVVSTERVPSRDAGVDITLSQGKSGFH